MRQLSPNAAAATLLLASGHAGSAAAARAQDGLTSAGPGFDPDRTYLGVLQPLATAVSGTGTAGAAVRRRRAGA